MAADSSERFVLLNHLADEFAARYRHGERPALQEYIDRHPELADDIRELFPAMVEIEQVKNDRQAPVSQAASLALLPLERLGDYRIIREIGRGGMGVVYEAEQVSLGRHVALKVLPQKRLVDAQTKRRFEREAKAAAKLHHTNIVPVFGVGEHDGMPYYVMQFIKGLGLNEVLKELRRLQDVGQVSNLPLSARQVGNLPHQEVSAVDVARSLLTGQYTPQATGEVAPAAAVPDATVDQADEPEALAEGVGSTPGANTPGSPWLSESFTVSSSSVARPGTRRRPLTYWQSLAQIGVQVANALEHAHMQGILHRDIKPSNLLLDERGTVWVTDFGLAKADDQENLTHTGDILGTIRYMPPEAFEGKTDRRGDIYALGLTLYELLALRPAFKGNDRQQLIKLVTTQEPPRLDKLSRRVPRDLVTIVHKTIDREPGRRYASAADLAADLQRFLDDEPILARRIGPLERGGRWCRRNPLVAALLGTLVLVLTAAAVGSNVAMVHHQEIARDKSRLADQAAELAREREEQRLRAEASQRDYQRISARLMMERGISFCEQGRFGQGLLWLARGLELVPPQDAALQQSFRTLLGGWGRRLASQRVILQLGATVDSAAFSPDGRTILIGCHDRTAWVWRMEPDAVLTPNEELFHAPVLGQPRSLPVQHAGPVAAVAISPDGQLLATGSQDGSIELWTVAGQALGGPFRHHGPVRVLLFSPDGKTLASASSDHTARLWDVVSGTPAFEPLRHNAAVRTLAFSPNGAKLVTGSDDATARLWDTASGQPAGEILRHQGNVRAVAFSPDGSLVLTAGNDQTARLWDASTGHPHGDPVRHSKPVAAATFSPDGKLFVTACEDGMLHLWHTGTLQAARPPLPHGDEVIAAAFSRDGRTLLTGCADDAARLWDVASGRPLGEPMRNHGYLHDVSFSPDARTVLTAGHDHTVRLWGTLAGNRPLRSFGPEPKAILAVTFSPNGQTIFVGSETGKQYDRASGRLLGIVHKPGHLIGGASYSPDGETIATGSFDGAVGLWDAKTGQPRREPLQHLRPCYALAVAFSPDGRTLLTGSGNYEYRDRRGEAQLWDVATGLLRHRLTGHGREVTAVAFSPDGKTVATASRDGTVRSFEADTGRPMGRVLRHQGWVLSVAFSPTGRQILTGSGDRTARLWDRATGEPVLAPLEHPKGVKAVAFSSDGRLILTGCEDGAVRLWETGTGRLVDLPLWLDGPVTSVAFSPDGRSFLTGGEDGFAHLHTAPIPWTRSPQATRHWVTVNANLKLDASGDSRPLGLADWQQEVRHLIEAAK